MKYWKEDEVQVLPYWEGSRILPYHHPASRVVDHDTGSTVFECEIIPFTEREAEYIDHIEKTLVTGKCVKVEIREWSANSLMGVRHEVVSLNSMGYLEEPDNKDATFARAMKIV